MDILIHVINQKMHTHTPLETFVSGSQKFVKFRFDLGSEWDGLKVFAQFTQNGKPYNDYLDDNNCVYLPPEITEGSCTLMLYGCSDDIIATTNFLTLCIDENIFISDAISTEISQPIYNQIIKMIDDLKSRVNSLGVDSDAIMDVASYNFLVDLPTINGIPLMGDLKSEDLGIAVPDVDIPTKVGDLENDAGYITNEDLEDYLTTDYNELENKPAINGVSLDGDKTTSELKINIPTKMSNLTNDAGFVTLSDIPTKVGDLENDAGYITSVDLEDASDTDYVVEQGSYDMINTEGEVQGVWFYRKWFSGVAECWGEARIISTIEKQFNESSNWYVSNDESFGNIMYPFEFSSTPIEIATILTEPSATSSAGAVWCYAESTSETKDSDGNTIETRIGYNTATHTGHYRASRPTSASSKMIIRLYLYVKGFWDDFKWIENGKTDNDILFNNTIEDHWMPELENGVKSINTYLCEAGRNKSSFLFYSDSHWSSNRKRSPVLLKYLYENTGINKTIFGGDIVDSEATDYDTMKYLWEWRNQIKDLPNHHSVAGNHDDGNKTDNLFNEEYIYGYLLAAEETPDITRDNTGLYYYIDNPAEKTRYIYLDTACQIKDTESETYNNQINFLTSALKSVDAGWHIVVISHAWFSIDYEIFDEDPTIRPAPISEGLIPVASGIATVLDDFNARRGDDFEGCNGKVEFCIGGHIHYDYVGYTSGGIPIIVVETDSTHLRGIHTKNTNASAASVNGVIADYNNSKIHIVRVGRGNSFDVSLSDKVTEWYYSVYNNLTNVVTSSNVIEIKDGDAYTANLSTSGEITNISITVNGEDATEDVYNYSTGRIEIPEVHGDIVITAIAKIVTNYTNVLPLAGYEANTRWSTTAQNTAEQEGTYLSGWIEVDSGDVIRLKNINAKNNPTATTGRTVVFLSKDGLSSEYSDDGTALNSDYNAQWDSEGNLCEFTIRTPSDGEITHMRIQCAEFTDASVITINEEIN